MNPGSREPHTQRKAGPQRPILLIGLGMAVTLVALLLLGLAPGGHEGGWDFRVNLWGPSYLLVHGQSPYDTQHLIPIEPVFEHVNAIWLPPAIGTLFPLGWLEAYRASDLWFLGNTWLILFLVAWMREKEPAPRAVWVVLPVYLLLFLPLLTHLILGQFSLLTVFLLLVAARLVRQRHYTWAGLAVVLTLTKPQLVVLALPGLWLAVLRRGGARGALRFTAAAVLGTAVTTIPLWIAYPGWLPDLVQVVLGNPSWFQPTLYTNLELLWGQIGWFAPIPLSLGLFALNLWLWWKYPPEEVMPWSLALTTVASPYVWTWDFVLLVPLILRSLFRQRSWSARAIWGIGLAVCCGLMSWIRLVVLSLEDQRHHLYVWVPWLILLLVLGSHAAESHRSGASRPALLRAGPMQEEPAS